jgi:putative nucleotidyltransferase with HDIG domain
MEKDRFDFIRGLGEMSAFPDIALELMNLLNESTTDVRAITRYIRLDQSLAVVLLKACHSPVYGIKDNPASIEEAIELLGYNRLRTVLMSHFTHHLYTFTMRDKTRNLLWYHSIGVAVFSRALCQRFNLPPQEGYLAGLLHDIGKLVLYRLNQNSYRTIVDRTSQDSKSVNIQKLEEEFFGFDHTRCGQALLAQCSVGEEIRKAVLSHHDEGVYLKDKHITGVVAFADQLVHKVVEKKETNVKSFLEKHSVSIDDMVALSKDTLADLSASLSYSS